MRKFVWFTFCLWFCGLLLAARAETYQLMDGTAVSGDIVSFNDVGIIFRGTDDKYTDRVAWTKFSQDALKAMSSANPKIKPLVEPFIEIPASERPQKPEVKIKEVTRLAQPAKQSLFSALFSSSVGLVALLLIYAANLYAGYEVAVCRARSIAAVMGVAAVLPVLGPIIFLSMPIKVAAAPVEETNPAEQQTFITAGVAQAQQEAAAAEAAGLHIAHGGAAPANAHPEPQIFKRGQFTFNRRFIETKFAGFFGTTRRGAEKDMVLVIKTSRDTYVADRITRIASNDAHFETIHGAARQEVMVAFADIQEMQLKHKDA
ncbi:MAG: hypothetical protein WDM76_11180 [Limisphaerales bacterium]